MTTKEKEQDSAKRLAWNGFSFNIPDDWNLSYHSSSTDSEHLRLEDDTAIRLEMDWITSRSRIKPDLVQKRYSKMSKELLAAGAELEALEELPTGWTAFLYTMPDKRRLVTFFRLFPGGQKFCFMRMHFEAASRREAIRLLNLISTTFEVHEKGPVPWEIYDISFQSPRDFRLVSTSFLSGRKILSFEWKFRRLYYMFFSLSDIILKEHEMEDWCAEFLNGFKDIRGPEFFSEGNGVIGARHTRRYPVGHIEELMRRCLKYWVRCRHIPERNQIVLVVFNYRKIEDIDRLLPMIRPAEATQPAR